MSQAKGAGPRVARNYGLAIDAADVQVGGIARPPVGTPLTELSPVSASDVERSIAAPPPRPEAPVAQHAEQLLNAAQQRWGGAEVREAQRRIATGLAVQRAFALPAEATDLMATRSPSGRYVYFLRPHGNTQQCLARLDLHSTEPVALTPPVAEMDSDAYEEVELANDLSDLPPILLLEHLDASSGITDRLEGLFGPTHRLLGVTFGAADPEDDAEHRVTSLITAQTLAHRQQDSDLCELFWRPLHTGQSRFAPPTSMGIFRRPWAVTSSHHAGASSAEGVHHTFDANMPPALCELFVIVSSQPPIRPAMQRDGVLLDDGGVYPFVRWGERLFATHHAGPDGTSTLGPSQKANPSNLIPGAHRLYDISLSVRGLSVAIGFDNRLQVLRLEAAQKRSKHHKDDNDSFHPGEAPVTLRALPWNVCPPRPPFAPWLNDHHSDDSSHKTLADESEVSQTDTGYDVASVIRPPQGSTLPNKRERGAHIRPRKGQMHVTRLYLNASGNLLLVNAVGPGQHARDPDKSTPQTHAMCMRFGKRLLASKSKDANAVLWTPVFEQCGSDDETLRQNRQMVWLRGDRHVVLFTPHQLRTLTFADATQQTQKERYNYAKDELLVVENHSPYLRTYPRTQPLPQLMPLGWSRNLLLVSEDFEQFQLATIGMVAPRERARLSGGLVANIWLGDHLGAPVFHINPRHLAEDDPLRMALDAPLPHVRIEQLWAGADGTRLFLQLNVNHAQTRCLMTFDFAPQRLEADAARRQLGGEPLTYLTTTLRTRGMRLDAEAMDYDGPESLPERGPLDDIGVLRLHASAAPEPFTTLFGY